jgi:muramidase (phage lysozyme)
MPSCTFVGESSPRGDSSAPYGLRRYRARNGSSSAGGKYQILDTTWIANGGRHYADSHPAAVAPPLEQEKVARVVLRRGGLSQWANC